MKLNLDGSFIHLKTYLVAKHYSHMCDIDYQDIISPMAKMTLAGLLIFFVTTYHQLLHQLTSKMFFFMVFLMKKSTWSNQLNSLLRESLRGLSS